MFTVKQKARWVNSVSTCRAWSFGERCCASALKDGKERGHIYLWWFICTPEEAADILMGISVLQPFGFKYIEGKGKSVCTWNFSYCIVIIYVSLWKVLASYRRSESSLDCKGAQKSYISSYISVGFLSLCLFFFLKKKKSSLWFNFAFKPVEITGFLLFVKALFSLKRKEYLGTVIWDPGQSSSLAFWKFSSSHFLPILVAIFLYAFFSFFFF